VQDLVRVSRGLLAANALATEGRNATWLPGDNQRFATTLELELVAELESNWSLVISERETVSYRSACMVFRK